jgi:HD-GYP domain-containing protein (c-di-GMP phosphodiesterase class II)
MKFFIGIRYKMALLISILLAIITLSSSAIVINLMNNFILENFLKRGVSMGTDAAVSAGYSLMANDLLALDNLSVQLNESAEDIIYVAVVDTDGVIKAHSDIGKAGEVFQEKEGAAVSNYSTGATVTKTNLNDIPVYEFKVPIIFSENKIGYVYIDIDANALVAAQIVARRKINILAILVLGIGFVGTFFLSKLFTNPIKKLSTSVSELSSGRFEKDIQITTNDELGELTANFNEMAQIITEQRWKLEKDARDLEDSYLSTVKLLAAAIDARCPRTLGHSTRVAKLSVLCGVKMGLSREKLKDLEIACLFHDVGKIRIPDHILQKEDILNDDEKKLVRKHSIYGAEILKLAESLHRHIPAVLYHHEWYNGEGYPKGLKGSEIPLFAAIISIADAYDAVTSARPYRGSRTKKDAIEEIRRYRGIQFAPKITDIFLSIIHTYENNTQKLLSKYESSHAFIIQNL